MTAPVNPQPQPFYWDAVRGTWQPMPVAAPAPVVNRPSVAVTVLVTLIIGLFAIFVPIVQSVRASKIDAPVAPYWLAFILAEIGNILLLRALTD